jgi:hypothetical protein
MEIWRMRNKFPSCSKLQVPKFPFARKFLANGSTVYSGQNRSALWYSDESDKDSLEGIE